MIDYNELIDTAAVAAANERHRQVRMRADAAAEELERAETAHDEALRQHDITLGDGGDTVATAKALREAEDAVKLARETVPAVGRAIERSAVMLRSEVAEAHGAARDAAERALLEHGAEIDRLRRDLATAFTGYREAVAACTRYTEKGVAAIMANARPPHVPDDTIVWVSLPADRDVAQWVAPRLRGNHPKADGV